MAVGYNPRAITDGLVLSLDAGNPKNYNAGISTNWTDKVGGNNGTLVGGTYHNDGPFVGAGYVFFDGIDSSPYDYVTTSTSSDFTLGTDDFTIEFFFKSNNSTNRLYSTVIAANMDSANTGFWELEMNTNTSGTIVWKDRGNTRITATNTNWYNDQWHHLALTREGTSVKLFLDGTQIGSTATYSYTYAGTSVVFGSRRLGSSVWNGNMSNLRILKGTALYTSNFTPPTKQLTAITNTVLLTCQGNTISDASSGGHTLTANGTAAPNLGSPASAFEFDGSNDYVDIGASSDFNFGTGDFTVEGWVNSSTYSIDNGAYRRFFVLDGPSIYSATGQLAFMVENTNGKLYVYGPDIGYTSSGILANGSWNHFAVTRIGNTIYLYVNGSAAGSISHTGSFSPNSGSPRPRIGAYSSSAGRWNGKISAVKIYKGKGLTAAEVEQNYNATKGRYA